MIRVREYLRREGAWSDAKEQALLEDCARQVDDAVAQYLRCTKPPADAMFDHLFAQLPAHLREQRDAARRYASPPGGHSNWQK
jgi:pyruvate dehydrogenase E1 component alpha subunit